MDTRRTREGAKSLVENISQERNLMVQPPETGRTGVQHKIKPELISGTPEKSLLKHCSRGAAVLSPYPWEGTQGSTPAVVLVLRSCCLKQNLQKEEELCKFGGFQCVKQASCCCDFSCQRCIHQMLRFFSIRVREKQKFKNFLNSSEEQFRECSGEQFRE